MYSALPVASTFPGNASPVPESGACSITSSGASVTVPFGRCSFRIRVTARSSASNGASPE